MGARLRRRARHVAVLAGITGATAVVAWLLLPGGTPRTQRLSLIFAYVSLGALLVTLALGPLNLLRARPNPTSSDLRRDVGLWAAAAAAIHVVCSLQHHFGGDWIQYLFTTDVPSRSLRTDQFGTANWFGVIGTLVLLGLAAISNDVALRRLGRAWKPLQRANYLLVVLVVVHTVLFWSVLDRNDGMRVATAIALGAVLALQLLGIATMLRSAPRSGTSPPSRRDRP